VPLAVVEAAGAPWEDGVSSGALVPVSVDGVNGLALEDVATAEDAVADEVLGLAAEGRLAVAYGAPRSDAALVVADVHRLSLEDVASALQAVDEGIPVVLSGDPDALLGSSPGAVLRDAVAAGIVPVHDVREPPSGALGAVLAGLRRGELVAPDRSDRGVVVVTCADDAEVAHRVGQLVGTSVPRAFDLKPADIVVLTPLRRGVAGVEALSDSLTGVSVTTVHEAAAAGRTWPAVVLCLPGEASGVLSRALLVSAFAAADRHVSVVTAVGPDLDVAVARVAHRPVRRTRLAALLRDGAALG
jgi:hypothetical protein